MSAATNELEIHPEYKSMKKQPQKYESFDTFDGTFMSATKTFCPLFTLLCCFLILICGGERKGGWKVTIYYRCLIYFHQSNRFASCFCLFEKYYTQWERERLDKAFLASVMHDCIDAIEQGNVGVDTSANIQSNEHKHKYKHHFSNRLFFEIHF